MDLLQALLPGTISVDHGKLRIVEISMAQRCFFPFFPLFCHAIASRDSLRQKTEFMYGPQ